MKIHLNKTYNKAEGIVTRDIAGETLLVPIHDQLADMQRIFSVGSVSEYIWNELDGEKKLYGIRDGILENYSIKKETADLDLMEFIAELIDAGLVIETV